MIYKIFKLVLIAVVLIVEMPISKAECTEPVHPDYNALMSFYEATNGNNWYVNYGWTAGVNEVQCNPCEDYWFGVECNDENRVIGLWLNYNNLEGTLPNEISALDQLENLSLYINNIQGNIPNSIAQLTNLKSINLRSNQLSGSIPIILSYMENLEELILSDNQLTGGIPPQLGLLENLKILNLSINSLEGSIPESLGNMINIEQFRLYQNNLTGSIPQSICQFPVVEEFVLYGNNLSGCLPNEIFNYCNLAFINILNDALPWYGDICNAENQVSIGAPCNDVYENSNFEFILDDCSCGLICNSLDRFLLAEIFELLDGENWTNNQGWTADLDITNCDICNWYGITCNNNGQVTAIDLSNNNLTGNIPNQLLYIAELTDLNLANNNLYGCYEGLLSLCNNVSIDFSGNNFLPWLGNFNEYCATSGSAGEQFLAACENGDTLLFNDAFDELCNCSYCSHPDYYALRNLFSTLSTNTWNEADGWEDQNHEHCNPCDGSWSGVFCDSTNRVSKIILIDNGITASLRLNIGDLSHLTTLILSDNSIYGNIPHTIGNLERLEYLVLDENDLGGYIPNELNKLTNLKLLNLSENNFTSLPDSIGKLSSLEELDISFNALDISLPSDIGDCEKLKHIKLSNNNLFGLLPTSIYQLPNLISLDVAYNQLTGTIPVSIENLVQLSNLKLNNNFFHSNLPNSLANISSLNVFLANNNDFSGAIPTGIDNLNVLQLDTNNFSGCIPAGFINYCGNSNATWFDNLLLPYNGNKQAYCNTNGSIESQVGVSCVYHPNYLLYGVINDACECVLSLNASPNAEIENELVVKNSENAVSVQLSNKRNIDEVYVSNINGKLLKHIQPNNELATINWKNWPNGVYIVLITSAQTTYQQKVVKLH